jgi:hypothetical protein
MATPTAAHATTAECDRASHTAIYRAVLSGVSFSYAGRAVMLYNHTGDLYSYTRIDSGYQSGDLVWIDRSRYWITSWESPSSYPSTETVNMWGGGWKQCGPFSRSSSNFVYATTLVNGVREGYATRACIRPSGGSSRCGNWYIDRG